MKTSYKSAPIEPLLTHEEVAGIFGYKLPADRSAWCIYCAKYGVPLVRLSPRRLMGDPQQLRDFIASRSTGKAS